MSQYKNITIPKGSKFNNAIVTGFGNVTFKADPENQYEDGNRYAKKGEYKILSVADRSKENTEPFLKPMDIDGFSVKIGTIVNIELTKDVTNTIPKELIMYGQPNIYSNTTDNNSSNSGPDAVPVKKVLTTKNIILALIIIVVVFGFLKLKKDL